MSRNKIRRKDDVQLSYHRGYHGQPMLNVKTDGCSPYDLLKFKGNKSHEFGDDEAFWAWFENMLDSSRGESRLEEYLSSCWEWACESGWEQATEDAREHFGRYVKVYSAGRCGGWLVVEGLDPVEEWDAIMLGRWRKFARWVDDTVADIPYQVLWHLHENIWEPMHEAFVA